jgi:membrane associated rhomboid family serine protease
MSLRQVRDALVVMAAFLVLIWVLQVANWADGYRLDASFGIWPRNIGRVQDIFTAPFLHLSWNHIEGNSVPLFILGFLSAYRGVVKFVMVTLIVAVTSGLAVWMFQSGNELTVGASGLIFGYFGYVLVRGLFDRNLIDVGVGFAAAVMYWTILQVAIPGTPGISWIGHLGGLVGGVLAGWVLRARPDRATVTAGSSSVAVGSSTARSSAVGSSAPGRSGAGASGLGASAYDPDGELERLRKELGDLGL